MIKYNENSIELTRGDTAYLTVSIPDYTFQIGDEIKFGVKKDTKKETPFIIEKTVIIEEENEYAIIKIEPKDTENEKYGDYVFDIQITQKITGDVNTIIPPKTFTITEEVC